MGTLPEGGECLYSKKRFADQQITSSLRPVEAVTAIGETCRKMGFSEITRLQELEDEISKLKRLVAELALNKTLLCNIPRKGR